MSPELESRLMQGHFAPVSVFAAQEGDDDDDGGFSLQVSGRIIMSGNFAASVTDEMGRAAAQMRRLESGRLSEGCSGCAVSGGSLTIGPSRGAGQYARLGGHKMAKGANPEKNCRAPPSCRPPTGWKAKQAPLRWPPEAGFVHGNFVAASCELVIGNVI